MLLGLFTSAIQALVFATLAGAYIGEALEGSLNLLLKIIIALLIFNFSLSLIKKDLLVL